MIAERIERRLGAKVEVVPRQGWRGENRLAELGLVEDLKLVTPSV